MGTAEVGTFKKPADRQDALSSRSELAVTGNTHAARTGAAPRLQRQCNVEPIGGQEAGRTIRPFHKRHRTRRSIITEAELSELSRSCQTIKVGVHEGEARQRVGLRQSEGG